MTVSNERAELSAVKMALLAGQVRARLVDGEALGAEPIAITGIGCRLPGGANSPEAFWELIRDGVDAISEVPADRWSADDFYDPDPYAAGKMNTRWGGFVDGIDRFDAAFFGISPREAAHMDPQQRMLLEVAVEAFERAGQPIERLAGTATGVFVASSMLDYGEREHAGATDIDAYSFTGNVHCIIPNRLSFTFDLRGPSVSIDTACSSSLVAVHLACQSLRARDSDLALAGGVNAILSPTPTVGLSKWGLMAPDGRCKTFDARADGFVRSEGCGVVVLKRLADAIADNDPVLAVIRGSAVNQDGRSTAMTAPNGRAQQDVVRRALEVAQVRPEQIGAVELHGTGTVLGDPIEVEALTNVLGAASAGAPAVAMTAVKTNIGHLECAAGVAGLIKMVLCLQHGAVPPPVHFTRLNPHISLEGSRLFIPSRLHQWTDSPRRLAGVSAFGLGGTNAHAILEEAPQLPAHPVVAGPPLLLLSAKSTDALRAAAVAAADRLERDAACDPSELLATAALRRTHHDDRLAVVGASTTDLIDRLRAFAVGERNSGAVAGRRHPGSRRRVGFVFSGQGNQWWGMARDLLTESPIFRSSIDECDELLRAHVNWSLVEELTCPETQSRLERTEIAQPVLFAVQVGLAAMWRSWGVLPDAIVGHSVGEVAAAHVSGALSLPDAVRVAAVRGASMRESFGTGAMASVELSAEEVADTIAAFGERLSIAAVNAPDVTVISGDVDAIEAASDLLQQRAAVRRLPASYPFHSLQMRSAAIAVAAGLGGLRPERPVIRIASTVSGSAVESPSFGAAYWSANVTETVRFADAVAQLAAWGCDTFVEIGPHPVLGGAISRTLDRQGSHEGPDPVVVSSLRRGRTGIETMAMALGELHCQGVAVDLAKVWPGRRSVVPWTTYQWQGQRHWTDTWQPAGGVVPGRAAATACPARLSGHPLVGLRIKSPAIEGFVFESHVAPSMPSFIGDHRIGEFAVMPATGFVEAALAASDAAGMGRATGLDDVDLARAMVLGDDTTTVVQIHLRPERAGARFSVSSTTDGDSWVEHARGRVVTDPVDAPEPLDIEAIRRRCHEHLSGAELSSRFAQHRIHFGEAFGGVVEAWVGDGEALARIEAPAAALRDAGTYRFHPALLDVATHPIGALLGGDSPYLPVAVATVRLHGDAAEDMWSYVRLCGPPGDPIVTLDASLTARDGGALATLTGLRAVRTSVSAVADAGGRTVGAANLLGVTWIEADRRSATRPSGPWLALVGSAADDLSVTVGAMLRARGFADRVVSDLESIDVDGVAEVIDLRALDLPPGAAGAATDVQQQLLTEVATTVRHAAASSRRVWIITAGAHGPGASCHAPEQSTVIGLTEAMIAEYPTARVIRVDVEHGLGAAAIAADVEIACSGDHLDDSIAIRAGVPFVRRVIEVADVVTAAQGPTRVESAGDGMIESLRRVPLTRREPADGEIEIEVACAGLNFRDVLVTLDLYPERSIVLGDECAGIVTRVGTGVTSMKPGDRVIAIAPGAFATHVTTRADLAHVVPAGMSLDDAATIPIAFLTAQYALVQLAGLTAGNRVLIHAGAGGVGMAAIQIAKRLGATVLATAGTDEKRRVLRALGVEHVFDSRSMEFVDGVMAATDGAGVDVVLNSLAGDFIGATVGVLARGGRFLEIGRLDVWTPEQMAVERPDVTYRIVFLGDLTIGEPAAVQTLYRELLPHFQTHDLEALPKTVFRPGGETDALRLMAQARHIGKVVVRQRPVAPADGAVLITGGLGGIGLALARHLVDRGARTIVLASRTSPDAATKAVLGELRAAGADVRVVRADVSVADGVRQAMAEADSGVALAMVVHAAGVNEDVLADDLTADRFVAVLPAKVAGSRLLFDALADRSDVHLVFMSSASTVFGAIGQSNYVAANSYMDALATSGRQLGRATTSISWGIWDGVGMTARLGERHRARLASRGQLPFSADIGVAAFESALGVSSAHVVVTRLDPSGLPDRPLFSTLRTRSSNRVGEAVVAGAALQEWRAVVPAMRRAAISAFVERHVRSVMGLGNTVAISARQPLNELGLDSLMAVELRNVLAAALGAPQPATLLFDHPTTGALVDHLTALASDTAEVDATEPSGPVRTRAHGTDFDELAGLGEDEVEALLLAELNGSEERP